MALALAIAAVLLLASGCADRGAEAAVRHSPGSDVYDVPAGDPTMNAAISQAQATLDEFAKVLHAPRATQREFWLKVVLTDGRDYKHVWLAEPFVTDTEVGGIICNDVEWVSGHELGQPVTLGRDRLADWVYVDRDVLQGGFTIRVLREKMSGSERAEYDRSVPFRIE
ncbi:MAG: DUF2314 domain-containing protein [Actinomycetota bacterium]